MRVALRSLGCRLNEAELENWSNDFKRLGFALSRETESADIVVVNTCAVTQEAVKKSRQLIRKACRVNPGAKLVVSGCYASLNSEIVNELEGIDLLVQNRDKDRLAQIVVDEIVTEGLPVLATEPGETPLFGRGRNRAFVKVQDGCRYRCTFCIVTLARGDERSKAIAAVINEINTLYEQGVQEVILTGVHIGGYGSDIGSDLYTLVKTVLAETDVQRLRLGSVEPWDLGTGFFDLFDNPRLMPHLHLPLQHGSDAVLRRMARRCKTADFRRLLEEARECVADFNVTTDIIVGFPGESECEWEESLEFIEASGFSHIHIFPYSPRLGTRAALLPEQVPATLKKQRCRQLHQLADTMRRKVMACFVGRHFPVLFENQSETTAQGGHVHFGYTPNYLKVKFISDTDGVLQNRIRMVRLAGIDTQANHMNAASSHQSQASYNALQLAD